MLDEATSRDSVHPGKWHHVMFSYIEALENTEEEEPKLIGRVSHRNPSSYTKYTYCSIQSNILHEYIVILNLHV